MIPFSIFLHTRIRKNPSLTQKKLSQPKSYLLKLKINFEVPRKLLPKSPLKQLSSQQKRVSQTFPSKTLNLFETSHTNKAGIALHCFPFPCLVFSKKQADVIFSKFQYRNISAKMLSSNYSVV